MSFENSQGKKIQKIFQKFGLDILNFEERNFLSKYWTLPFERDKVEYRITLGKIFTLDDLEENWEARTEEEFLKKFKDRNLSEFKKDLKEVGKIVEIDRQELTFSIFLPPKTNLNKNLELTHLAIWQSAALYFFILKKSVKLIYSGGIHEQSDILYENEFGKFLTIVGAKITNANIKEALDNAYRLYKDSKFFYELFDYLGSGTYDELITQLEKVK